MKNVTKFCFFLFLISMFFGIGYAAISNITLEIDGSAQMMRQTGVIISDVHYVSNVGANLTYSNINTYYQAMLSTTAVLSPSNSNSNLVYSITILNDTTEKKVFKGIDYDPAFYDNNDIEIIPSISIDDTLDAGDSVTFTITIQYKSGVTPSSNNNELNSFINFKFEKYTWVDVCDSTSIYLSCRIISQTANSDSSINFSSFSSASNGRGLYYTSDLSKTEDLDNDGNGEVVYYYRGNVTNNFVRFDSYCWRIVRTNEDGSIRLIYGGTPQNNGNCPQSGSTASIGNSAFNSYGNNQYDNVYFGYMYGTRGSNTYAATHTNTNNSTIKTTIDNWYRNNLSDSASYLADYPFCNDRTLGTGNGYGTSTTEYATQVRFYGSVNNQIPTFKCNQANDKFTVSSSVGNGALTNKIALLSSDEAVFAGCPYAASGTNSDCYLRTGAAWWLMSPGDVYNRGIYVYEIANNGLMRLITTTQSMGTRPVINLLPNVTVSGGAGTYNDPYVVNGIDVIPSSGALPPNLNSPIIELPTEAVEGDIVSDDVDR